MTEVRATADVYSLGAILYATLTSRVPFQADNPLDTVMQVLEREPVVIRQLNPTVPRDLETICLKCLEKDGRKRYPTAQALADELRRQKGTFYLSCKVECPL
jgi:serine/threonine protein kinase